LLLHLSDYNFGLVRLFQSWVSDKQFDECHILCVPLSPSCLLSIYLSVPLSVLLYPPYILLLFCPFGQDNSSAFCGTIKTELNEWMNDYIAAIGSTHAYTPCLPLAHSPNRALSPYPFLPMQLQLGPRNLFLCAPFPFVCGSTLNEKW